MKLDRRQALALMGAATLLPSRAAASDAGARIDAILTEKLASEHVPGGAFIAVRGGEVVHAAAFGVRDRAQALPVTLDTLFPIGSATKPFTSMAAGVLQDRGLLSLDDHPRDYLPWFRLRDPEADAGVTIRDMLSHTTGLRAYADLSAEPAVLTREEYVRATMAARPEYPFRTRFQYSNAMITAAGLIVGALKGGTWEQAVTDEVLRPLGMHRSLASFVDLPQQPDHATGYVYDPAAADWTAVPPPRSLIAMAPAGSICASANELAHWLKALTRRGAPLVGPRTFGQLTEPQIGITPQMAYALSWAVYGWNGQKVVEHNGGSRGICALVSFLPEADVGFAFLGNTSPNFLTRVGSLGPLIYPLLLGVDPSVVGEPGGVRPLIPVAPSPAIITGPPPAGPDLTLDEILARIATAPGQLPPGRHSTLIATGEKAYEHQGIVAPITLRAAEPALHEEDETWHAAGREIGRLRIWFDGESGGQETTFGQDALNDPAANAEMRRDFDFRPWRNLHALHPNVRLAGTSRIDGRPVLRLEVGAADATDVLSFGLDDWLLVRRERTGTQTTYADYRPVDGELLAHRIETRDGLGLTTVQWSEMAFDAVIPAGVFAPSADQT